MTKQNSRIRSPADTTGCEQRFLLVLIRPRSPVPLLLTPYTALTHNGSCMKSVWESVAYGIRGVEGAESTGESLS